MLAAGCDDDTTAPQNGETITLSATQASAIRDRVIQLAPVHPELAWLADSIQLVIMGGAEVQQVAVTTGLGGDPFYAVSLQRTIRTSFSGTAAFDVILFNNPSNPTDFIIVNGWINPGGTNTTPPTSVTGTFGSPTSNSIVNAHLFHVEGNTVTSWRGTAGTAAFSLGTSGGACVQVLESSTVECEQAVLHAEFNVTEARSDTPIISSTRSASMAAADVSGIIIRMLIQ